MATSTNLSRRDLKQEHRKCRQLFQELQDKLLTLRTTLNRFADGYIESEAFFPWKRSKVLNELVQSITSDSIMQDVRKCVEDSNICPAESEQPKASIPELLTKIDTINALQTTKASANQGQGDGEKRPLIKSKGKRLFRRLQKISGFSTPHVQNEDVMTTERLQFCLRTLERQIKSLHEDFERLHAALNKLSLEYASVRAQCFCCRYFNLKRIIETAIEETDAETQYE
ncbi:hypothetical protein RRG08_048727 [Elysia crispata]|uniref:Uncharacterized protein n=1 Tax=Elysia crispata TaxID=231223 RepID=A0AAE1EB50_9GAST|nr:hypothetical protein RRG08_048727 [Elysia crispata]